MDERPPADEQAGVRRWAVGLGMAAAAVPVVEQAGLAVVYGGEAFGFPYSVAEAVLLLGFSLAVRIGIPLAGALLVLRGGARATTGLAVLVAFGILQLPTLAGMTWQILGVGMPPWFWFAPAVAVAAGGAALLALRGSRAGLGARSFVDGRGLVAAGAVIMAIAAFAPSVAAVTPDGGTRLSTWGGFGSIGTWVIFQALDPAALLVLGVAVALLWPAAAAAGMAGVLAVNALFGVAGLLLSLAFPAVPERDVQLAVQPAFAFEILAAVLLVAGFAMLWRRARA